ncbi:MAG: chemotaxis protein CheW [Alphaproteobacteria bacterium]|nr:chemotaxis protein CheW [Alphaproteobacteria bacterium]
MNDLVETLWGQFGVETEEHLDLIEPLLARAGPDGVDADGIGQLFRSFHSIKGLARAMDLLAMERVAHQSENLLGLVRDGSVPLDARLVDNLLQAVDSLKALREVAIATRADGEMPDELVDQLARMFAALSGQPVSAASPPPPPPASTSAPPATAPEPGEAGDSSAVFDLHEDPEMLAIFVEMVQTRLPELALALDAERTDGGALAAEAAEAISYAATVMEFQRVAEDLERLARSIPTDHQPDAEERRALLLQIGDIREQMAFVGEATGQDVGADVLADVLAQFIRDDLASLIQELADAYGHIEMDASEGDLDALYTDSGEFAEVARRVFAVVSSVGCQSLGRLLLLLADVYHRVASGDLMPAIELFEATTPILEAVDLRAALTAGDPITDLDPAVEAELSRGFRQALAVMSGESIAETAGAGAVVAGLHLKPEMMEVLSGDAQARLTAALGEAGTYAYELTLHLESTSEAAGNFVEWLSTAVESITNRTVLMDTESWFEFLVLAKLPPEEMQTQLATLDPGLDCLKAAAQVTAEPGGRPLVGAAPPPAAAPSEPSPPPPPAAVARVPSGEAASSQPAAPPSDGEGQARPAPARPAAKPAVEAKGQASSQVLRVRSETIDGFMSQISELRVAVTGIAMLNEDTRWPTALATLRRVIEALPSDTQGEGVNALQVLADYLRQVRGFEERLDSLLGRLNANALDLRVVPIDTIFNRFPRAVRDLAQAQGKDIRLVLEGRDVRVDKGMVELLVDPLMHMVRNGIDHGIEPPDQREAAGKPAEATLALRAQQRGAEVVVDVVDDGRGLDVDAIGAKAVERGLATAAELARLTPRQIFRFIFAPGFSTAKQVTETSGRGVGMDVVLTSVNKLGGDIEISSERGRGTTITLRLPLSAALQSALLVEADGQFLGIPERHITAIATVAPDQIQYVSGQPAIVHRNAFLPIYPLGALLGMGEAQPIRDVRQVVILSNGRNAIGVAVDRLLRRQELFLKDLHPALAALPAIGGASVLGDGRVVLVLDVDGLIQVAQRGAAAAA